MGKDHTIFSLIDGHVKFKEHKGKKMFVSVEPINKQLNNQTLLFELWNSFIAIPFLFKLFSSRILYIRVLL